MKQLNCKSRFMLLGIMFVSFISNAQQVQIKIETANTAIILSTDNTGLLKFDHYGEKIGDITPYLKKVTSRRFDYGSDPEAYTTQGYRNFNEPALRITQSDGSLNTELVYVDHTQTAKQDNNVVSTIVRLKDKFYPVEVKLIYTAYKKENVITQQVEIINKGKKPVTLHNFYSGYLPLLADRYYLNHLYGEWSEEAQLAETQLTRGTKSIESRRNVRVTQTENPAFVLSLNQPMQENCGEVIMGALAWSGNFKLNFEMDEFNRLNICAGINPYASDYTLEGNKTFITPEMIWTYSGSGVGAASRSMHDWARNYQIYDSKTIRPTLLNSWEGVYFNFDEPTLKKMVDDAVEMGLEMFVLDDGWFGNNYPRNNAKAGLGDWQVNTKKLPNGIASIADYTVSKGLKFGIWIEPEMVNPESDLAKKHPEWLVQSKNRDIPTVRAQWLLDLSNPKVQDFVFEVFDNVMKLSPNITYIKWDANRHVESAGSTYLPADKQTHFWIDYVNGLYNVYSRIREKYPHVIMQACASGGGRVEYGALKYHQEVWTSDNTDGLVRSYIQYGTNLIYPALVTGSHVSAVPNHQTNNTTPLKYRFDMAMTGRLGMELQPKDMNENEKKFARMCIKNYKEIRDIVFWGDLYRIKSPYDNSGFYAINYVTKDKSRAVFFAFCIDYQGRAAMSNFKLNGLDPDKKYRLREINIEKPKYWFNDQLFSGEYLMKEGINPNLRKYFESAVVTVEEVK